MFKNLFEEETFPSYIFVLKVNILADCICAVLTAIYTVKVCLWEERSI